MPDALLRVEGLSAGYGDVQILWDLSLDIPAKSITALIGANGVGKTTFLRTLAGALTPYRGRVLYAGEDITARPQTWRAKAGIMMVPEGRQLYSGLPVEDNLIMGAYTRRDAAGVRRVAALDTWVGYAPDLEDAILPQSSDIQGAAEELLAW